MEYSNFYDLLANCLNFIAKLHQVNIIIVFNFVQLIALNLDNC